MNDKNGEEPQGTRFVVDDLVVDLDEGTVTRAGRVIDLPDLSFRLLAALLRRAPERVDKDQLITDVWEGGVVSDETLAQRVRLLRQALGENSQSPRYITAVRGRGYRLIPQVRPFERPPGRRKSRAVLAAAAVVFAVAGVLLWFPRQDTATNHADPATRALAVLPFKDMSESGDHQFFADGMHEELLSRLASMDGLAVISRTSVEPFRDGDLGLTGIAAELGADLVIEGSVRVDDERLRITVQLIDAATDRHTWTETYDRELSVQNIFTIQRDVAEQVARALQVGPAEPNRVANSLPTDSLEAYNLYLLGRYHTFRQSPGDLELAVEFLEEATRRDPEFAEAYAVLGWAWGFLGSEYGGRRPHDVYPKAREAALRALSLDSNLADARDLYADILTWYDWDFDAAEREYQKSIALDPLNVLGYALLLSVLERHDEAIAVVEQRLAATPDDPYVRVNAGWRYFHAGLYDQAVAAAQSGARHPDSASLLGWSRLALGDNDAAIRAFQADIDRRGRGPRRLSNLAAASFRAGRLEAGRALLDEMLRLSEQAYVSPALVATVYFAADDPDSGFRLLDEALRQRARDLIFLRVSWMLSTYRDDPRYQDLVTRVGLQPVR